MLHRCRGNVDLFLLLVNMWGPALEPEIILESFATIMQYSLHANVSDNDRQIFLASKSYTRSFCIEDLIVVLRDCMARGSD